MYAKKFIKAVTFALAALFFILMGGMASLAGAFSVDVDNLTYTDTSGPRDIKYDFLSGDYGVAPLPANTIGLPAAAILLKDEVDLGFAFGVVPEVGSATLSAPSNSVATFASLEGAAILQGSSSTTPPPPSNSWTFSLALKNFAGLTDAAKRYRFEIGAAVPPPANAGSQPRFGGEWDSSGNLSLQAAVENDETGDISFESTVVALPGLTPATTSIELKIDNNTSESGKVIFSYRLNGATEWTVIGTYTIASGVNFYSLPAFFPYLYIEEGGGGTISFSGLLYDSTNSNPIGGATVEMAGNASINVTTDTTTGAFVLNGLPAGELFSVKMSPPVTLTGLVPTYSQSFQSTTPISAARTYNLFAVSDLTAWGTAAGTGVIRGRVMNSANLAAGYVSGAVVSYTSSLGNAGYRVMYENIYGNLVSGGGTFPNGKFYILDVALNDMVTVSATHSNYSIMPTAFGHEAAPTQADSVYQGLVKGPTVSGRVAIGGYIKNTDNPQVGIKNVVVGQAGVTSPVNATMSNGDGFFYLNLPQATPVQVKFEKPQDTSLAPTYSAYMTFGSENLAIGDFNLFAKTTLAGWTTNGKGIIRARVKDASGNYLAGATVTATSALHPETGTPYQICYDDACSTTATDATTGRYIVKNVDDGDTVTVTAHKDGYAFNTRIFPTHSDSMHQGSVTGTANHPEAATIQARFEAAMDLFNANNFDLTTGFPAFVSNSFLDYGENKAMFVSGAEQERAEEGQLTWTIRSISGDGDYASVNITWGDGEIDTLYFHKEGDLWMLYGNQKQFDAWASSGRTMDSQSPSPYWVSFEVEDPDSGTGLTIDSVNVTGPGIESEINLYHNTDSGQWQSWGVYPGDPNLNPEWATQPTTPLDYVFTINYTGGTLTSEVQTITVESFVNAAPALESLSPASGVTATRPLTFSWASAGDGYRYGIELHDANGNRIWESYDIAGTSVVYDGPEIGGGQYNYTLSTRDGYDNASFIFNNVFQLPLLYSRAALTSGTGTDNHPAWSPDGSKIAFTSNRSGVDNIWVVNADGSGLTQLTTATGYLDARYPSWSPDGTTIAYIVHNSDPQIGGFGAYFLYTMNADGTGQTPHPLPPGNSQEPEDQFWEFEIKFTQWLDSDRIAFVSFGPEGGSLKHYHYRLSTQAVTPIAPEEDNPDGDIYKISWNASTSKLAYDRWPIGIQTINSDGTNYQVLDIPRAMQMDTPAMPGWRPDGAQMAFVKDMYNVSNIGIFDMTTKSAIVEGTATDDEWPAWSPDGNTIAFVSNGKIWTMAIVPPTVNVTGKVYNWQGTAPLAGVTVDLLGTSSSQSKTTDANGNFTVNDIPAGQSFYLKFRIADRADIYTGDLFFNGSASVDLGVYTMPTTEEMAALGLTAGKGIIMGRVLDQQLGNGGRVSGAVVTATSSAQPVPGYTVTYRDPLGNYGGTATYGNGRYYVFNVDDGDVVTVTATKGNRSPASRTFHTFSGAANEGNLRPAAPAYDLSFSGVISNTAGEAIDGALVEIDGYPTKNATTETGTGAFQLDNLPRDVYMNLRITKDGYVPAFTGGFSLGASVAGVPLTLFTQSNLDSMGVTTGNGLIAGRVVNQALSPVAGAVITVASNKEQTYTVNYGGGTATPSDGRFWIPNVLSGDVVTVTVAHPGYNYPGVTYLNGYADAVTEKLFIGSLLKGDINGDVKVDLADAILALQVMAGMTPSGVRDNYPLSGTDVNGDAKIGQHELIYLLQYLAGLRTGASVPPVPSATPYTSDANTVLLDHFDGATGAAILAYSENGASCGPAKPPAIPKYSYGSGPNGLNQSLILNPPVGQPVGSGTYLKYPDGQLLSQANGTIEFWTYLTSYGLSLVAQGPFPGSCAGWTFGMGVNASGQLTASAWAAFNMNSGSTLMPLNTWTHVAATWGSAGAKLYMNGVLVGSDGNTGMPASGYGGSVLMNYGAGSVSTNIDELRISNIQRTTF